MNSRKKPVIFGCTVLLENIDSGDEVTYQLVGSEASDVKEGRLSIRSPLGRAIIGKSTGDKISITAPGGKRNYELIKILQYKFEAGGDE